MFGAVNTLCWSRCRVCLCATVSIFGVSIKAGISFNRLLRHFARALFCHLLYIVAEGVGGSGEVRGVRRGAVLFFLHSFFFSLFADESTLSVHCWSSLAEGPLVSSYIVAIAPPPSTHTNHHPPLVVSGRGTSPGRQVGVSTRVCVREGRSRAQETCFPICCAF